MDLIELLKDSLKLLRTKPKVFIPKFVTTALYTVCIIVLMKITLELNELATGFMFAERAAIIQLAGYALLTLIFLVFIYFIDLLTYAMYPSIVSDYHSKKEISLRKALREALDSWLILIVLGITISVMAVFIIIPFGIFMTLVWENLYLMLFLLSIVLVIILVFAMLVFFVIPVAVIEKKGFTQTFRDSFRLSLKHRWSVLGINLVFLFLTLLTLAIGMLSGFQGSAGYLAIALFVLVRFVQATIYTYISVINPYFYVKVR